MVRLGTVEVVVFRVREVPEFLALKRSESVSIYPGLWQIVSGTVEKGEKAWEVAVREVLEETGLRPQKLYNTPLTNVFYLSGDDSVNLSPVFAVLADASADVKLSREHVAFEWLGREQAISRLVWPGQKRAIQTVCDFIIEENPSRALLEISLA
jgi:8-oxo-dGTP pyrophosphatase MutT (NUDIX family)